jgi:hypothetical protein
VNSSDSDKRVNMILYTLIIVLVGYATVSPIGLPIPVSQHTRTLYDFVETLNPGDTVYIGFDYGATNLAEIQPAAVALSWHCFSRDVRIIGAGTTTESGNMMNRVMDIVLKDFPDKEYGVDWVNIGYKGGTNAFFEAMGVSFINAAAGTDFQGNRIEDMPILKNIKNYKDVKLAASMGSLGEGLSTYVKLIGVPHSIPVTGACFAVSIPESMPLVVSGQLTGMIAGMKGAAEYEQLLQKPGSASVGMDAQSLTHVLIILFVIIGNVRYFLSRNKGGAS